MNVNIDAIRAVGDFATVYQWNLSFVTFPNAVDSPPSTDDLNIRCETTELPLNQGQSIDVMIRSLKVRQPGIYVPQGILSLQFIETVDSLISQFLYDWRQACFDVQSGAQGSKLDVEATVELDRLDRQGNVIWTYHLVGCYLEGAQLGQLDGVSPEAVRPTLIMSYDYFTEGKPSDLSGGSSAPS
jgi:hypothetical protein